MNEYYVKKAIAYMRYHDFPGEDTTILLIHGLGCACSFDYPQVVTQQELCNHRRILVDLLGAGFSDKPLDFDYSVSAHAEYIRDFIEDLGLKSFILFGHSLGGSVAIELAKMCANKVHCLILSEANLDSSVEGAISYEIAHFTERYFVDKGFYGPVAAYRFSQSAVNGGNPSWRNVLYGLSIRRGFIFGERSLPDKDYEELKQHGIKVETVLQAGHSMACENPTGLAFAIKEISRNTYK